MNHWIFRILTLCISVALLLASCQTKDQLVSPVTGANAAIPTQIEQARVNILEYIISSSRLANIPPDTDWQLNGGESLKDEYHFLSGDWLMVIWDANTQDKTQRVVISNEIEKTFWCGYVAPDGHVVDTAYMR